MATFVGQAATNNTFNGTAAADIFQFAAADLNALDTVTGGGGNDQLQITTAGLLAANALAGVSGVGMVTLTAGTNSITFLDGNMVGVTGAKIIVNGASGADTIDGSGLTGANALDIRSGSGLDILKGGAGADVFRFAAADLAGDTVIGGAGSDILQINVAGVLGATALSGVSGVETITLAAGTNSVTLVNGNFTGLGGGRIAVLGNTGADTIDGSGLTGANAAIFNSGAGLDTLKGGAGADAFRFAAADLAGDTIIGGAGTDQLQLSTAGVLGATALSQMSGVEEIVLAAGTNSVTLVNGNLTGLSNGRITVFGASGADTVDGSGLTGTNAVDIRSGSGTDVLKGGAGADVFRFSVAEIDSTDTVIGGAGADTLAVTTAGVLSANALAGVSGIETISLTAGTNGVTLVDNNLTGLGGARINVLGTSGADTIDASGLTGTNAVITLSGSGLDVLKGGAGADIFRFTAADLAGDTITGGAGIDQVLLSTAGVLGATALAQMTQVEQIVLATGTNSVTVVDGNLSGVAGNRITVFGANGADTIDGSGLTGANSIDFRSAGGLDVLKGGAGADVFRFAAADLAGDTISGGAGSDTLQMTSAGVLAANALANMTGVETIALFAGDNSVTVVNGNLTGVAGSRIVVQGSTGNDTIDASGLTGANSVDIRSNAGSDVLKGGAGADFFRFAAADFGGDTVQGGAGSDTLQLTTAGTFAASMLAGVTGIETVQLANGTNVFNLTDALVSSATATTVSVLGGTGDDLINGGDVVTATNRLDISANTGNDTVFGGSGADTIRFAATALDAGDTVNGGTGAVIDTLAISGAGTVDLSGNNIQQIEAVTTDNADHTILLDDFAVTNSQNQSISITSGTGADTLNVSRVETAGNAVSVNLGDGSDTLILSLYDPSYGVYGGPVAGLLSGTLGAGNDTLKVLGGFFNTPASLSGGSGTDTIEIDNYYGSAVFMSAAVTGFEIVNLVDTITGGSSSGYFVANDTAGLTVNGQVATNRYVLTLGAGGQTANGNGQNDSLFGGSGNDTVNGNGGADFIEAFGGSNTSNGGAGNDSIVWHAGDAVVAGGADTDTLISLSGGNFDLSQADQSLGDSVNTSGFENIELGQAYDPNTGYSSSSTIGATAKGSSGANIINGSFYSDVLDGNGGADQIFGKDGADTITYRGTEVEVNGYYQGTNYDVGQNDTLVLAAAATVNLNNADQTSGDTVVVGGFQNIDASALSAGVSLTGDIYDNRILGGSGADAIAGNDGSDWIDGGAGADTVTGGTGNDTITYRATAISIAGGADTDTLRVLGAATINLNNGDQTSGDTAIVSGFENVNGSASSVSFSATGRNDVRSLLVGGSAADTLTAGAFGADIFGNGGADTLVGGAGNDTFFFLAGDVVAGESINGGGGTGDTISASATTDFSAATISNVEVLSAIATNANGDLIQQNVTVTLTGAQAAGLTAINANASYYGSTTETFIINVASGTTADLSALTINSFDGTDTVSINGAGGNETITGPAFATVIHGNGGNDTIKAPTSTGYWAEGTQVFGDAGNDRIDYGYPFITVTLDGGADSDTLVYNYASGSTDQIDLSSATDQTSGDSVVVKNFENIDWTLSNYSLTVTGSSAANSILGSQGSDTIDGGAGLDTINGQAGDDLITYRSTASTINGGLDTDTLKVLSAVTINLNNGDQTSGDAVAVSGFENVDASGSSAAVKVTGRNDLYSIISGGSAADTITAGIGGSDITGNGGADTLVGRSGSDGFYINAGDFAAGESINGGGDYDYLYVRASTDFTVGTLTNLEYLAAYAADLNGNPLEQNITVTLTGAQAAGFDTIDGTVAYNSTTVQAFIVNVASGTTVDLSATNWYLDAIDTLAINGAGGNETITAPFQTNSNTVIHGNDGNDTLRTSAAAGGYWGNGIQVFGDAGNDRIDYGYRGYSTTLDGGADSDTLVYSYFEGVTDTFDLSSATDQSIGDTSVVKNFENLDWSASGSGLTVTGSSAVNNIIGSDGGDTIDGGAGLDVIDGGSGDDLITYRSTSSVIGGGADTDTLKVLGALTMNLNSADQTSGDTVTVTGFENVDASGSSAAVNLTGRDDVASVLIGGSAADTLTAGSGPGGAYITGGAGADTLVGAAGDDGFYINSGDFAAGESINGGSGYDQLYVRATTDFTVGTLSNLDVLYANAADASGNPIEQGMTVTLTGAQAAGFASIYANNNFPFTTAEAFIINVASGTTVDLSATNWNSFDVNLDTVAINGAAGNETITAASIASVLHGNAGNDTLRGFSSGYWANNTTVFGDAGNDRIDYGYGGYTVTIDGGADTDTLVYSYFAGVVDQIDLSQAADQSIGDSTVVKNFENLDWSASLYGLTATGSSGNNLIIASQGADTLTGGAGSDVFGWQTRDGSPDTITDFLAAADDLRFASSAFDFNGAAFDQRLATASTAADITGKDLIIYTGGNFDSVGDVQNYLNAAAGGSVGEGVFIVGKNSSNHTVLYHALDASYTVDSNVVEIADLGTLTAPTSIQLTDFLFV